MQKNSEPSACMVVTSVMLYYRNSKSGFSGVVLIIDNQSRLVKTVDNGARKTLEEITTVATKEYESGIIHLSLMYKEGI